MVNPKRFAVPKAVRKKKVRPHEEGPMKPFNGRENENNFRGIPFIRQNVGARNPFIIAKRVIAQKGKKVTSLTPRDLPMMMEMAFGNYRYNELFDPRFGSPVYYGIYPATLRLAQICPKHYGDSLYLLRKDPARNTGYTPIFCDPATGYEKSVAMYMSVSDNGVAYNMQYRDTTALATGTDYYGLDFHNPVQGCVADCWLISALSSIAWAEKHGYPTKKLAKTTLISLYYLYNPTTLKPARISTSVEFYLDSNLNDPYYARNDEEMTNLGFYECWPCYYEKCFASYYQQNKIPKTSTAFEIINCPDYDVLNYKDSFAATQDVTGKPLTTADTAAYLPDRQGDMINDIRTVPCNGQALSNGAFIPAQKPVTAYTYLSADYAAVANDVARYGAGSDVVYDMHGLPANHTFSLLGLYMENNTQYVVLRNPWGFAGDAASFNQYSQNHRIDINHNELVKYIANPADNGIFGLDSVCFMRYFESFGWTA